jgi:hypothetical protein
MRPVFDAAAPEPLEAFIRVVREQVDKLGK